MNRPSLGVAAGGVVAVIGAVLPWARYDSVGTTWLFGLTTDGPLVRRLVDQPVLVTDGWIVAGTGGAIVVTAVFGVARGIRWAIGVSWAFVASLAALTAFEIAQYLSETGVPTQYTDPHDALGPGLLVVGIGTVISGAALLTARLGPHPSRRPRAATTQAPE